MRHCLNVRRKVTKCKALKTCLTLPLCACQLIAEANHLLAIQADLSGRKNGQLAEATSFVFLHSHHWPFPTQTSIRLLFPFLFIRFQQNNILQTTVCLSIHPSYIVNSNFCPKRSGILNTAKPQK